MTGTRGAMLTTPDLRRGRGPGRERGRGPGRQRPCPPISLRHRRSPTPRKGALRQDEGNALVEFVVLSAALLIPSLYLVLTLGSVQAAVFAADTIARDAARIHAVAPDQVAAGQRTQQHTAMILEDFHLSGTDVVQISCSETPCSTPGGMVTAEVRIPVPVPGLGPILGETGPVTVGAAHAVQVDRYRVAG